MAVEDKDKYIHVWLPVSPNEYEQMREEGQKRAQVKHADSQQELLARRIILLHTTTREEMVASGLTVAEGFAADAKQSSLPVMSNFSTIDPKRIVEDENANKYVVATSEGSMNGGVDAAQNSAPSQVLISPSIRVFPTPRPNYILSVCAYAGSIRDTDATVDSHLMGPFVEWTARLPNRGSAPTEAAGTTEMSNKKLQFAITLPGQMISIPNGTIVRPVPLMRSKAHDAYLVRLDNPLIGPSIGLEPWRTSHILVSSRFVGSPIHFVFDPERLLPIQGNVYRPVDESKLLAGNTSVENLIPLAVALLLKTGEAEPGAVDGTIVFGYPAGSPSEMKKEDESITELLERSPPPLAMRLLKGTPFVVVPPGTSLSEAEKKSGRKMKFYGADANGRWLYVSEDDDKGLVLGNAKLSWDNPTRVAQFANLAMLEHYWSVAEEILSRLLELRPGNYLVLSLLAAANLGSGNLDSAEKILVKVVAERPQKSYPHFLLGQLRLRQNRTQEAVAQYSEALSLDPNYSDAMACLRFVYANLLKDENAGLEQILAIAATYMTAHGPLLFLAGCYERGDLQTALEFSRAACERRPTAETVGSLSGLLGRNGRIKDVIALVEHFDPKHDLGFGPLNNLATAYEQSGEFAKAAEIVGKILQITPPQQRKRFENWRNALLGKAKA